MVLLFPLGRVKTLPYKRNVCSLSVGEAFKPPASPVGELAKILIFD